jgi:hypothetical protein
MASVALMLGACGEAAEPAEPAEWAAGMCSASERFAQAILESRDEVEDPSSLDLTERKERAARLGEAEIAAAQELADELDAIEPPEDAREFHEALITQANDLVRAIEEQVAAIEEATSAQQIAVANASAQFELQGSRTEVNAAAAGIPDDLVDVLANQPECGQVPVPGEPTPVVPTPAV